MITFYTRTRTFAKLYLKRESFRTYDFCDKIPFNSFKKYWIIVIKR